VLGRSSEPMHPYDLSGLTYYNHRHWRGAPGSPIFSPRVEPTQTARSTYGAPPPFRIRCHQRRWRRSRHTVACTPYSGPHTRESCSARTALRGTPESACRTCLNLLCRRTPTLSRCTRTLPAAASSASPRTRAPSARAASVQTARWFSRYVIAKRQ
jgi:hypothetical protein